MFTTFVGAPLPRSECDEAPHLPTSSRRKRSQVSKACEWCRVHRIKCDSHRPCRNCLRRGGECSNDDGTNEVRTLPSAIREIERLKLQVKELEEQLKTQERQSSNNVASLASPVASSIVSSPTPLDPMRGIQRTKDWGGIHASTGQSGRTQYYGPPSYVYRT